MKSQMINNNEPKDFTEIVELLNNLEILHAINNVIRDARTSGVNFKKYINGKGKNLYQLLVSLVGSTS